MDKYKKTIGTSGTTGTDGTNNNKAKTQLFIIQ